jgi:hypothetical protein
MLPFRVPLPNLQMTQQKPDTDYHELREEYELPIKHFRVTFYVPPKMASPSFLSEVLPSLPGPTNLGTTITTKELNAHARDKRACRCWYCGYKKQELRHWARRHWRRNLPDARP